MNLAGAAAAAAEDDARLQQLLAQHYRRVYRYGTRVCSSAADAEDATQEAFIKLAGRRDVQADPSALPWLYSVVRNACLKLLARMRLGDARLGTPVALHELAAAGLEPSDAQALPAPEALHQKQMAALLMREIARLPPTLREVLLLRDIEELDGPSVCTRLGLKDEAMKSRLHRARQQLRVALRQALEARLERF